MVRSTSTVDTRKKSRRRARHWRKAGALEKVYTTVPSSSSFAPAEISVPHFGRPQSHFKKGHLRLNAPTHVLKVPDADNLAKFVLDALQKKILTDDKIVSTLVVHKRWCLKKNQRTEVELWLLA